MMALEDVRKPKTILDAFDQTRDFNHPLREANYRAWNQHRTSQAAAWSKAKGWKGKKLTHFASFGA